MTSVEIVNKITTKDWDRAMNVELNRIPAMFKAIKDDTKKIGRMAAYILVGTNNLRNTGFGSWHTITSEAKRLFTPETYSELIKMDIYSIPSLVASPVYDRVMSIKARQDEIKRKEEEKRVAEMELAKKHSRIDKALGIVLETLVPHSRFCMRSNSDWHSFGGRIGQYSHYWTNSNGNRMSQSSVDNYLYKYKNDGKHFCSVSWNGGYSYDWSTSYEGGEEYYLDIARKISDNVNCLSDCWVSIYTIPRLNKKIIGEIKTKISEANIPEIKDDEILTAIKKIDIYQILD